jgi:hypothetical protein
VELSGLEVYEQSLYASWPELLFPFPLLSEATTLSPSQRPLIMEFLLLNPPAHGYGPGDTVSGELKYNITAQQETILDVRLHLDGSVLIHPSKLKYEAHRSNITLIEESQTPFQGPFTLKRQLLVWPFAFVLPATALVGDVSTPLPPSMDHQFREGVHIRVGYSITATIREDSNHKSAKQASKVILVKHPADPTESESRHYALSFPPMALRTDGMNQRLLSRLWSSSSNFNAKFGATQRSMQLEMTLPVALSVGQQETVTCCLAEATATSDSSNDTTFVLEVAEFVLRRHSRWQNILEDIRTIGAATSLPGVELTADGQRITLPGTLGLQNFMSGGEMFASLTPYKMTIPEVSQGFTMTVTVSLKHKVSGRRIHSIAMLPVVIIDADAERAMLPTYERLDATQETVPPPYEDAANQ